MDYFLTKTLQGGIKDVDLSKRTVQLYFSNFDTVDSDNDMVKSGAFLKTFKEWGPEGANRIKHWRNHNPNMVIGVPDRLFEDSYGAGAVSILGSNSNAKDALLDYQEGLITEHSFGYSIVESDRSSDYQLLTELKMFEYSAVTLGANENTPVVDIKGLDGDALEQWFKDKFDTITKLTKAKTISGYSDDKLIAIEHSILVLTKQLQQAVFEKFAQKASMIEMEQIAANDKREVEAVKYLISQLKK